jgi:hypothetical protein
VVLVLAALMASCHMMCRVGQNKRHYGCSIKNHCSGVHTAQWLVHQLTCHTELHCVRHGAYPGTDAALGPAQPASHLRRAVVVYW